MLAAAFPDARPWRPCAILAVRRQSMLGELDEDRNRGRGPDRRQSCLTVGEAAALRDAVLLARAGEPRAAGVGDRSAGLGRVGAGGCGVRRGGAVLGALDA